MFAGGFRHFSVDAGTVPGSLGRAVGIFAPGLGRGTGGVFWTADRGNPGIHQHDDGVFTHLTAGLEPMATVKHISRADPARLLSWMHFHAGRSFSSETGGLAT